MMPDNGAPSPTLAQVHEAFGRWLAFPTDDKQCPRYDLVDIALAVIVANRMETDPLWLLVVAPPSSGKTEVIRALGDVPDVVPLSSLTPQTFASGFERKGTQTSLLPKLTNKILVMKDFTTILTMYREKRAEILAQLREIYDGQFSKEWGNGKSFQWTGKVGLLAGVTGVIDREYALGSILGERFLLYRLNGAPAHDLAKQAIRQRATWEQDQRRQLRQVVVAYLETLLPVSPPMADSITDGIVALAQFTARARSPVFFDPKTSAIDLIPEPEAPGRLAKQFDLLARALAIVRQERQVSLETYATVMQVANDTLPTTRQTILQAVIATSPFSATTTEIATATDYPTTSARRYLQELTAMKLVNRKPEGHGMPDKWDTSDLLQKLLREIRNPLEDPHPLQETSDR
jgi:FaeA-like protein